MIPGGQSHESFSNETGVKQVVLYMVDVPNESAVRYIKPVSEKVSVSD